MAVSAEAVVGLEQFEQEVTSFLDAHLQRKPPGVENPRRKVTELERLAAAKAWQLTRYEAGLGWIMGPQEYGGRELTIEHERLYRRLESRYDAPEMGDLDFGLTIVASAIVLHGSE